MNIDDVVYFGRAHTVRILVQAAQMNRDTYFLYAQRAREGLAAPTINERVDHWTHKYREKFNLMYYFECEKLEPAVCEYILRNPGKQLPSTFHPLILLGEWSQRMDYYEERLRILEAFDARLQTIESFDELLLVRD